MPQPEQQQCACGAAFEVVGLDLTTRQRCPGCELEQVSRSSYELLQGQIPPDLTPLRNLARRNLSGSETVEIDSSQRVTADAETISSSVGELEEEQEEQRAGLAEGLRGGLENLRERLAGSGAGGEASEQELLPAGTVLGGYTIEEPLGKGGMGVVYKARDTSLDRFVALKVLSAELCRNKQFIERFDREAKAVARLSHPNITTIYQYSKGDYFFAMEYVEGENLADRLAREGPFPLELALDVARQTCEGLKAAAANKVIHRDIKPSNLLLTPGSQQLKITDFGLAKAKASMGHTLDLTSTGVVMGTPLYMSPEQARGGTVDLRSDIYSLGATLFFLVYGTPPYEADSPIAIILKHINDPLRFPAGSVPAPFKDLLARMMAKDIERRPPDYDALLEDLARVGRGEPLHEESERRIYVLANRRKTTKRSLFKVGKLSVARTNLKLGRREKAVSLLVEAVKDGDPGQRCEAALLLLDLYEGEQDREGARRMAEIVLESAREPTLVAYAAWKLGELEERQARERLERAIEHYERVLRDPPEELPRGAIEAQVRRIREQLSGLERDSGTTSVQLGGREP